jgi:HEAT repeat protein
MGLVAVPGLLEGLRDRDARVRSAAATALARIGRDAKAAVPALVEALPRVASPEAQDALRAAVCGRPPQGRGRGWAAANLARARAAAATGRACPPG